MVDGVLERHLFINMTIEEINLISDSMPEDSRPIIIKFEPWNFVDSDNLILQFFNHLGSELKLKDRSVNIESLGVALDEYSDAIELAKGIPIVGKYASLLKYTMTFAGNRLKNSAKRPNVLQTKEKLANILQKQKNKIIIIIDDIDRLSNNQIRLIFQLVSSVAGLPNIIYLLSMDKGIVERALEAVQECNGNEYLEKIIQIPFDIPEIDKTKVMDLLFNKLNSILEVKGNHIFNKEHWSKVYMACVEPYISSIRDVNRVINTFQLKYDMMYTEVDFADMFGITVLQVMEPEIVKWIIAHRGELIGSSYDYKGVVYAEQQKKKDEHLKNFQEITENPERMLQVLSTLFPKFSKEVDHYYKSITDDELRKGCNIAHEDKFILYFELNIDKVPISRGEMQHSIKFATFEELKELVFSINEKGIIIQYLQDLRSNLPEVPYERIPLFVELLFSCSYWFKGIKARSLLSFSAYQISGWCVNDLIKQLKTEEERFNLYIKIIENADIYTLHTISTEINRIELGYGRLAAKEEKIENQIITLEHLIVLEELYSERISTLLRSVSLFDVNNLLHITYLWKNFDYVNCYEYITKLLGDSSNILKFIVRLSAEWTGSDGKGWTFSEEYYKEFVSTERILEAIEEVSYNEKKEFLTSEELLKLASFVLNQNKGSMDHADTNEAEELVNEWAKD